MAVPIVVTKLHVPPPPRTIVPRARLIAQLEAGLQGQLVLISAPAGFGKTTLLAEWAAGCDGERWISWVHLDVSDNDLGHFLSYVVAALQIHQPDLGEAALSGLFAMPPASMEAALGSLINELNAIDRDLVLILDDYHQIGAADIHAAVDFLIEHAPVNLHLVMTTRTDPPLPLHRLRARGQLTELRADALRFNRAESELFLEQAAGQPLAAADLADLDRRVEGWVAGLQMVALRLKDQPDAHEFIASFSGSNRYIMDYLSEEIYSQQPDYLQAFLLKTSVLDRLSGPLCEAVLAQDAPESRYPAQQLLEHLERANLFLIPLDENREWYRYHHLFAGLLNQRLRQTWPEALPGLFRRASAWCADNGFIDEAIKYALAGDDAEAAARVVESQALELLKIGALNTLMGWLHKLPEQTIRARPWLSVHQAWGLLLTGRLEALEQSLQAAEQLADQVADPDDLHGHIAAIRAYAGMLLGEPNLAAGQAQQALDLLPEEDLTARSVVAFVQGAGFFARGDLPAAIESMQAAGRIGAQGGNIHLAVAALNSMGEMLANQGKLSEAEQVFQRALQLGTGRSGRPLPITAGVYSAMAQIYLIRRDLPKARQFASIGVELGEQWGNMDSLAGSYLALAQIAHLEGNPEEARAALEKARQIAADYDLVPGFDAHLAAYEARILQAQPAQQIPGILIEPLSERELEVLSLMAAGRSNPEIAAELIIALGTVKAHSSSIYRKLDVRGRTQAVIRARELGLL
ncbi:MAG: LuxR C-terminal-related transcriptional regulator [Anaerolineales bacterium]|jgi:LuxR family maltose regulon positive regulatory protein